MALLIIINFLFIFRKECEKTNHVIVRTGGDLMCFEKARQLEKIRLFHAELSNLLQLFSLCYGPLLLNLFMFSFVDMLFFFFFVICMEYPPGPTTAQDFLRKLLSLLVNVHAVIFITTVLAIGSRVNEKVDILES